MMMEENNNNNNDDYNDDKIVAVKSRGRKRCIISRWLWERGVRVGRNVMMTAVVVSSAPLVLPPLIAISAMGFAVWAPAAVVVAGHAAVEKLMSTLLPLPPLSSSSPTPHDDDDDDDDDDDHKGVNEKDFDGEEEEFVAIDENLEEESYYVEECVGEGVDENLTEGVGEYLKREDGEGKDVITEYGNFEKKSYEDDGGRCIQGEEYLNLKVEYSTVEDISKNLEEGDKYLNLEDAGEHLEGDQWGFEGIPVGGDLIQGEEEGYMDEVNDLLEKEDDEGECPEGEKDDINNNAHCLKEGYMEDPNKSEGEEEENAGEQEDSVGSHASERSNDVKTKEIAHEKSTKEKIWVEIDDDQYLERDLVVKGVDEKGYEEEKDAINVHENLEKKGYEDDGGKCIEGEQGDPEGIKSCLNLKVEYNVEDGDKDVDLEEGYEEGVDKYLEGERRRFEEIPVDGDLIEGEGYMEEVDEGEGFEDKEYFEGGDRKEIAIDEGLEEGYEGDDGEYLEEEQGGATIDWNLEGGERLVDKNEFNNARVMKEGYMEELERETKVEVEQESHCGDIGESVEKAKVERVYEDFECNDVSLLLQKDEINENEEDDAEMDISARDDVNAQETEQNVTETDKQRSLGEDLENDSTPLESGQKYVSDGMESESRSIDDYTCTLVSLEEGNVGEQEDSVGSHTLECSSSSIKTKESAQPSNEAMGIMSEEEIWEQVCAIRAILGYRDAKQSSTVDEIKALFVFIGVEPPSPFDDPSHLTDVYEKLKILMSIVGTK